VDNQSLELWAEGVAKRAAAAAAAAAEASVIADISAGIPGASPGVNALVVTAVTAVKDAADGNFNIATEGISFVKSLLGAHIAATQPQAPIPLSPPPLQPVLSTVEEIRP